MVNITVDFANTCGEIKAMNGVNNGPVGSAVRKTSAFGLYKDLEISYARLHDSSFHDSYGGEHTIDVHRIFKNFDADENDPASYLFGPSDEYIASIIAAGTKPFYRLGASIEHHHKVGTHPPKDYTKWARICEHIIMHYNEGWANGFNYDIEYWEIWNEPECSNGDGTNPCWQGTEEEFIDFFEIAAKHLKGRFPNLKFGGPAFCGAWFTDFRDAFLRAVSERKIPLDFYSYHAYVRFPEAIYDSTVVAREMLEKYGLKDVELVLDEWNYVRGWTGDDYKYSMKCINGLKGSSLVAGAMCAGQASSLGKLMYYDARPNAWCGLYDQFTEPQKTYHVFKLFKELRKLGTYVKTDYATDNIYTCAATDGEVGMIFATNYSEHDTDFHQNVAFNIENLFAPQLTKVQIWKIDENNNGEAILYDEHYYEEKPVIRVHMRLFETYLIKIIPVY